MLKFHINSNKEHLSCFIFITTVAVARCQV